MPFTTVTPICADVTRSPLTSQDIAWAAGIYEGEGTTSIPTKKRGNYVRVTQKDSWLTSRLQYLFGGTVRVVRGGINKQLYNEWSISGPTARGFLMTVYGFLSPRRKEQARLALEGRKDYIRGPQYPWNQSDQFITHKETA